MVCSNNCNSDDWYARVDNLTDELAAANLEADTCGSDYGFLAICAIADIEDELRSVGADVENVCADIRAQSVMVYVVDYAAAELKCMAFLMETLDDVTGLPSFI